MSGVGAFRLINVRSHEFEKFADETNVKYAVLSHRWEDGEVDLQQMQNPEQRERSRGYRKIRHVCNQALRDGLDYVWVDTCCINKQSDAELTEAINSMFRWYQSASVCYLFLFDVQSNEKLRTVTGEVSELFRRGWTLQELLAPRHVTIYDQDWRFLGTKESLGPVISQITSIDEAILRGEDLANRSIAQRMSWAAGRKTTRLEDRAYSLLGIFGVYMPILYGEGENAFFRLQQEIIRQSDDHSIFAWPIQNNFQPGLLAPNPDVFADCSHIISMSSRRGRSSYSMTNRGLAMKLLAVPSSVDTYFVRLDCADERIVYADGQPSQQRLGMFLRRRHEEDQYSRVIENGRTLAHAHISLWVQETIQKTIQREFYVKQQVAGLDNYWRGRVNGFRIVAPEILVHTPAGKPLYNISGPCTFDPETCIMKAQPGSFGTTGEIDIEEQDHLLKLIKLGFDFEFNPVCFLASRDGLQDKRGGTLDRRGGINTGSDSQRAQYTSEERAQWPGIHQRNPFDNLAWSRIEGSSVETFSQHWGLWALRGDRLEGLSVKIPGMCSVDIARGKWGELLVWEVRIYGLEKSLTGELKGLFKRVGGT